MKKVVFILAGLLAFMLIGCGGGDSATESDSPTGDDVVDTGADGLPPVPQIPADE